jgi:hypothetical protein
MSVIKRNDVQSHLRSPFLAKTEVRRPESQPDATGFSGAEPDAKNADPSVFDRDFVAEHSSSGSAASPSHPVAVRPQAVSDSKRAQA